MREFQSRTSTGVCGMTLKGDDEVISLSILHRSGATQDEREAYLRAAPWKDNDNPADAATRTHGRMQAREQFILTVCQRYGKRSSAYEYRRTNRGGQGITNIDNIARNGPVVASFPAHDGGAIDADHRSGQEDPHGNWWDARDLAATPAACACSTLRTMSMW